MSSTGTRWSWGGAASPSSAGAAKVNEVTLVEPDSMHHARLKQRFYMHTDFTSIRIVPMHGFMKNSDYSCTVTMHVQKIQKIAPSPIVSTSVPQSTTDRPIVLSAQNGPRICVNQYIIHIFMQCALKMYSNFSDFSTGKHSRPWIVFVKFATVMKCCGRRTSQYCTSRILCNS